MKSLILHPTPTAQWYALINEAQQNCSVQLHEELESYLVFLLMRFTDCPALAQSVLGLEFLKHYHAANHTHLKEVADKCLLFAGLFPGRASRRRVKISYFVKLGQAAYAHLSNQAHAQDQLFEALCDNFKHLMDVLQATRENHRETEQLLESLELWHETGSSMAFARVQQATRSWSIMVESNKKH